MDTQSREFETSPPPAAPQPQIIQVEAPGNKRLPLWILLSVMIGFTLPVCSCAFLTFTFISSLGVAGSGFQPASTTGVGDAVAVVRVEGAILSGDDNDLNTGATSGVIMEDLRQAVADPTVKAIVLRVDSPGGSVTGSAQIYEVVREIEKPVVTSMGALAASGGYYISAPTDHIIARPDTTTGSIGVILTLFNAEDLIDETGVDVVTITTGPNKALGSLWEDISPEQRDIFEAQIEEAYNDFIQVIVDGRDLSVAEVTALADGRTYTGRQAADNGLVDELGNLQVAITKAAELGGISGEPRIVEYERLPSLQQLLGGFSARLNQNEADRVMQLINELALPAIEYRYVGPASR